MSAVCPVCQAQQDAGLLCHDCTGRLERELGDVPAIVAELDITLSRQAKIGETGKSGKGWAREKLPIHVGAVEAADVLTNTLTTWARDVSGDKWRPRAKVIPTRMATSPYRGPFCLDCAHQSCNRMRFHLELPIDEEAQAARFMLANIPLIRRHPAVEELVDEVTDAIRKARHTIDRPADRKFFGTCMAEFPDPEGRMVTCIEEIWASPSASEVTCKVCGITHEIEERRDWLMEKAEDMFVTIPDASTYLAGVGHLQVTQAMIRGYVRRNRLLFRVPIEERRFRLGDLLELLREDAERAERRASLLTKKKAHVPMCLPSETSAEAS